MGKFDGTIIVSDLDGTFLGKNRRMVPENVEAIHYFQQEGGCFTAATGRDFFQVEALLPELKELCNLPIIACNGSYLYDLKERRMMQEQFLAEPDISNTLREVRRRCPDVNMRIIGDGQLFIESEYDMIRHHFFFCPERLHVMPYEKFPHGRWHKIAFDGEPEQTNRVREVVEETNTGSYIAFFAEPTIYEIQPQYGNKGDALARLKEVSGRADARVWAIGDYENDIQMLAAADFRATPANGLPSLKAMPGIIEVCDHDEGAIAGLIRHIESHL